MFELVVAFDALVGEVEKFPVTDAKPTEFRKKAQEYTLPGFAS